MHHRIIEEQGISLLTFFNAFSKFINFLVDNMRGRKAVVQLFDPVLQQRVLPPPSDSHCHIRRDNQACRHPDQVGSL